MNKRIKKATTYAVEIRQTAHQTTVDKTACTVVSFFFSQGGAEKKKLVMGYRIKKRAVPFDAEAKTRSGNECASRPLTPLVAPEHIVCVCVDSWSHTVVSCSNNVDALLAHLTENVRYLATHVRLHIDTRVPVVFGGPGVYHQQLIQQMYDHAFVVSGEGVAPHASDPMWPRHA